MGYTRGPLLQALAERILSNLDHIERHAASLEASADVPPYADTQLLISLLGVIVFPHERSSSALGRLLAEHKDLDRVLTIRHPKGMPKGGKIELTGKDGQPERVDPRSVADLPRLLRNGVAHFNLLPLNRSGRFSGIRIWNENDRGVITLVADLDFDAFRPLARSVLKELADPSRDDLDLKDPEDPLDTLRRRASAPARAVKAPRPIDNVWNALLDACGGDEEKARNEMTAALKRRATELQA